MFYCQYAHQMLSKEGKAVKQIGKILKIRKRCVSSVWISGWRLFDGPGHEVVDTVLWVALGDGFEGRLEIGEWVNLTQFCRLNKRGDNAPVGATLVVACKECILTIQAQFPFILPMSGRFAVFTTDGTPILVPRSRSTAGSGTVMVTMSRWSVILA